MSEVRARKVSPSVESFAALTPTLPPATHTQSYALGGREVVLVEPATPYEDEQREWLAWAEGIRSSGRALTAIFATHHHPDHVGGATFFSEALGVPLWAHAKTAERLPTLSFARLLEDGEEVVLAGQVPTRWEVLHTPGHAPGHLCLFERSEGTAIVGDMVASIGTILIEPRDGDMIAYLDSLRRLEGLAARVALPAHGDPIVEPSARFRGYVAHRLMREGAVLRAVQTSDVQASGLQASGLRAAGGASLDELLPVVYADTPPLLFPIARLSLEAHLIKLVRDGAVHFADGKYSTA